MKHCPIFLLCVLTFSLVVVGEDEQSKVERIANDDDSIPATVIRIDFDTDPGGTLLEAGTDITDTYVPVGCKFASSYNNSYIAIEPYNVGGRSGGRCAANHKPLYQGTITVSFCKPGEADTPATVTMVGFWTSHVTPNGTSLEAYDKDDQLIGTVQTIRDQRDFLAIRSETPIACIKVVPDIEIDPDYAIDDLFFDTPKKLAKE